MLKTIRESADIREKIVPSPERRILWIVSMFSGPNNYPTSVVEMVRHLAKRGNRMTVIGFRPKNASQFENSGVNLLLFPIKYIPLISPILLSLIVAVVLPFILLYHRSEIVFFPPDLTLVGSLPTIAVFKLRKTKFVLDVRSTPVETYGWQGFLQRLSFGLSVNVSKKAFNGLTIITKMMKQELCQNYAIPPEMVGVWTSGVNIEHFNPDTYIDESKEKREELGLQGKFIVFYHGALSETRGIFETVKSMKIVARRYPQIVFFILGGEGPIVEQLKDYIKKETLGQNVLLHSRIPYSQVPEYIAMSDVCIIPLPWHPYWIHQCPLKLLEYMAMQKSVILSDIPAHRLTVGNNSSAIFLKSVDPEEIANKIVYAYENRDKLAKWGKGGRETVRNEYTWEILSKNLEHCLSEL